jgi:hypothetical protein
MVKLISLVILDALIGLAVAATMLAVIVPLLIRHHLITPGDFGGSLLIVGVLLLAVGGMVLRPGSRLRKGK